MGSEEKKFGPQDYLSSYDRFFSPYGKSVKETKKKLYNEEFFKNNIKY